MSRMITASLLAMSLALPGTALAKGGHKDDAPRAEHGKGHGGPQRAAAKPQRENGHGRQARDEQARPFAVQHRVERTEFRGDKRTKGERHQSPQIAKREARQRRVWVDSRPREAAVRGRWRDVADHRDYRANARNSEPGKFARAERKAQAKAWKEQRRFARMDERARRAVTTYYPPYPRDVIYSPRVVAVQPTYVEVAPRGVAYYPRSYYSPSYYEPSYPYAPNYAWGTSAYEPGYANFGSQLGGDSGLSGILVSLLPALLGGGLGFDGLNSGLLGGGTPFGNVVGNAYAPSGYDAFGGATEPYYADDSPYGYYADDTAWSGADSLIGGGESGLTELLSVALGSGLLGGGLDALGFGGDSGFGGFSPSLASSDPYLSPSNSLLAQLGA